MNRIILINCKFEVGMKNNKGLRIGLSFVLAFFAFFVFMVFFGYLSLYKLSTKELVKSVLEEADINGKIKESIGKLIADSVSVEIENEQLNKLLENEEFMESIDDIYDDLIDGAISGELDVNDITDDVIDALGDNAELISDKVGADISKSDIESVREEIESIVASMDQGESSGKKALKELENRNYKRKRLYGRFLIFGALTLGIIFCGVIIFLNRFRLGTGFRFVSIVTMIPGLIAFAIASIIRLIPLGVGKLLGLITGDSVFNGITGPVENILKNYIYGLSDSVRRFALVFAFVGLAILIASIVFTVIQEKKSTNEAIRLEGN